MLRTIRVAAALLSVTLPLLCNAQMGLESLLDKTSRQVSGFLEEFSDVKCTEQVSQMKMSKKGHSEVRENSTFDYFVLLQGGEDELMLTESRLEQKRAGRSDGKPSLLLTNGFSTLFLIFHPYYRGGFSFDGPTQEVVNGQSFQRLHFVHIKEKRTPAALAVRGREFPLDLEGDAWIDPATGMVARIDAGLANDMRDVGLVALSISVDYQPITLPGWTQTYRFPVLATVDVESLRQRWRNVHRFTKYQRFMVDTQQAVADSGLKK